MTQDINKKFQKAALHVDNLRQKLIVRVWGLAKRLDPKTMKEEGKKKNFWKPGNKGK